jgi:hypothetical protein
MKNQTHSAIANYAILEKKKKNYDKKYFESYKDALPQNQPRLLKTGLDKI